MPVPQSDAFKQAVIDSRKLVAKPSQDELLNVCFEFFFLLIDGWLIMMRANLLGGFTRMGRIWYGWLITMVNIALRTLQARNPRSSDRESWESWHVWFEGMHFFLFPLTSASPSMHYLPTSPLCNAIPPSLQYVIYWYFPFQLVQGKAKKRAWQAIADDGVTPEEAQGKYVALVEELKARLGFDPDKVPEAVGGA